MQDYHQIPKYFSSKSNQLVTAKCHLDPANLNSQTRHQSHEFNNIHTHTHTKTKLRIWKHQQFGNQPKTILIQSENAYNETRTHTHKNFTYNNIKTNLF